MAHIDLKYDKYNSCFVYDDQTWIVFTHMSLTESIHINVQHENRIHFLVICLPCETYDHNSDVKACLKDDVIYFVIGQPRDGKINIDALSYNVISQEVMQRHCGFFHSSRCDYQICVDDYLHLVCLSEHGLVYHYRISETFEKLSYHNKHPAINCQTAWSFGMKIFCLTNDNLIIYHVNNKIFTIMSLDKMIDVNRHCLSVSEEIIKVYDHGIMHTFQITDKFVNHIAEQCENIKHVAMNTMVQCPNNETMRLVYLTDGFREMFH
jgi:hypothetical protein